MSARLRVRVHPGARRERLTGWTADGVLRLEVSAPPEGGRANDAVVRLLAERLGVRRTAVRVVAGQTSRSKRVEVDGWSEDELRKRLGEGDDDDGTSGE